MPAIVMFGQAMTLRWAFWVLLSALTAVTFMAVRIGFARSTLHLPALALTGIAQAAFCAAASYALLALFLRLGGSRSPALDNFAANSFAIYLLHYPFVTWTQYGLLAMRADALVKGVITFAVALVGSWASASMLRRLPVVGRVI